MGFKNIFYAQSGGPTAVINCTACGVIEAARALKDQIGTVYAGRNGITGALEEKLIDTSYETDQDIAALRHTPSAIFGSCRYKMPKIEDGDHEYRRLIEVFSAHDIGYFFYNGGGDSQDTAYKISQMCQKLGYPLVCIGIPKTIDNDLAFTDNSPGYGSAAKYVAISTKETALDLASMAASSTKVFILEVMGRHAGWIAASSGMAAQQPGDAPHIILFPEIPFEHEKFICKVDQAVKKNGHCMIVVSEGVRNHDGKFLHEVPEMMDAFGHTQLGGVAPILSRFIKKELGLKNHWAVADYLQRSARHIASQTDAAQAYTLGRVAVEKALQGENNIMLTIIREKGNPYRWHVGSVPLAQVANTEFKMPRDFITDDGYSITPLCREYIAPLIHGEAYPPYQNGMPEYVRLQNRLVKKKLCNSAIENEITKQN